MAEKKVTTAVSGVVDTESGGPTLDGWVAPEVAAAEAGAQVDFSKHVYVDDDPELGLVDTTDS